MQEQKPKETYAIATDRTFSQSFRIFLYFGFTLQHFNSIVTGSLYSVVNLSTIKATNLIIPFVDWNKAMTKGSDNHPNLRHRKPPTVTVGSKKGEGIDDEETKPNLTTTMEQVPANTVSDGYVLIPLRERNILARLDIGPFLLSYGLLLALDFMEWQPTPEYGDSGDDEIGMSSFSLVAFPLVLFLHFSLFLVQQWSVSWRTFLVFLAVF